MKQNTSVNVEMLPWMLVYAANLLPHQTPSFCFLSTCSLLTQKKVGGKFLNCLKHLFDCSRDCLCFIITWTFYKGTTPQVTSKSTWEKALLPTFVKEAIEPFCKTSSKSDTKKFSLLWQHVTWSNQPERSKPRTSHRLITMNKFCMWIFLYLNQSFN